MNFKFTLTIFIIFFIACGGSDEISSDDNQVTQTIETTTTTNNVNLVTTTTNFCESFSTQEEKQNCYNDKLIKESTIVGFELVSACQDMQNYLIIDWMYDYYSSGAFLIEAKAFEFIESINNDPYNFGFTTTDDDLANELYEMHYNFESGNMGRGSNPVDINYLNRLYEPDYFDIGNSSITPYPDFEKGKFRGLKELRSINFFIGEEIIKNYDIYSLLNGRGYSNRVEIPSSIGFSQLTLRFTSSLLTEYLEIYLDNNPDKSHINTLYENYLDIKDEYFNYYNALENFDCNSLLNYAP